MYVLCNLNSFPLKNLTLFILKNTVKEFASQIQFASQIMCQIKDNIEILCEPLTSIIDASFRTGVSTSKLREAVVFPILKKPSLDKEILKHYRPVSNISYVSKLMDKICGQIKDHLSLIYLRGDTFRLIY